jgi:DNA-binding IclR family transcriptional regulator
VLNVLAQYPEGADRTQISILTGYKRSTRDAYVQRLAERGYADAGRGARIFATPAGKKALGPGFQPLPRGAALQEYWRQRLPEGERAILEVLLRASGRPVKRAEIDERTEYKRSSRDAYIQRLKARKLVEEAGPGAVSASEVLFR